MPEGRSPDRVSGIAAGLIGAGELPTVQLPTAAVASWPGRLGRYILTTLEQVLDEHRVLLWLALGYVLVGGLVLTLLARPWPLQVANRWLTVVWVSVSLPWLAWQWVRHPKRLAAALAPRRLLGAVFVLGLALPVQITFQSLKQAIGPILGFTWDPWLSRLDRALHAGYAWELFTPILHNDRALAVMDVVYEVWFLQLIGFICWSSWSRRRDLRQRALAALLLLWILGGTVTAAAVPSAGPCYYERVVGEGRGYAELMAPLSAHPLWARSNQERLWKFRKDDTWIHFGGISAFPSMHVGFSVLLALVAWNVNRRIGALFWVLAGFTQVGSVVLGWHYAVDGYAGALIAWGCWRIAGRLVGNTGDV